MNDQDKPIVELDCRCAAPDPRWLPLWNAHECRRCGKRIPVELVIFGNEVSR
jgi:hypothetical protein